MSLLFAYKHANCPCPQPHISRPAPLRYFSIVSSYIDLLGRFSSLGFPTKFTVYSTRSPPSHRHWSHHHTKMSLHYFLNVSLIQGSNNVQWAVMVVISLQPLWATPLLTLILLTCPYQHSVVTRQTGFISYYYIKVFRTVAMLLFATFIQEYPYTFSLTNTYHSTAIQTPTLSSDVVLSSHKTAGLCQVPRWGTL